MTTENSAVLTTGAIPTRAADGRTMIGHVIVCQRRDDDNQDAIAVWHVDTEGNNTGAWVMPLRVLNADPVAARTLLQMCLRRAVTAWNPTEALTLLSTLERAARVTSRNWISSALALPDMLGEVGEIRSVFEKRIIDEQQVKKNIVPLEWDVDLPYPIPTAAEDLLKTAQLIQQNTYPVAQEALLLSSLIRWCIQRWQETLTILKRRDYLQTSVKKFGVLPPRWERHVADAYTQLGSLQAKSSGRSWSGAEQRLDGATFVHGPVALGHLVEGKGQVEDLAGVDAAVEYPVDQVGQVGAHRGRATTQADVGEEQLGAVELHAVRDADEPEVAAGAGGAQRLAHRLRGADALQDRVGADTAREVPHAGDAVLAALSDDVGGAEL